MTHCSQPWGDYQGIVVNSDVTSGQTWLESETRHSGAFFKYCIFIVTSLQWRRGHSSHSYLWSFHRLWYVAKETGWDLGARRFKPELVKKVSTESLKPILHKRCVLASVLWLKRKLKRASGATCRPLRNLAMASDVNEKQRGRGMSGGDPFGTPRTPSCVLRGPPRCIKFHSWRWRKRWNWWATVGDKCSVLMV